MTDWTPVENAVDRWTDKGVVGVSVRSLSGEGWTSNADQAFVAASTIKIPIMIAVFRQIDEGLHRLDQTIRLGDERVPGSGILQHMHDGMELTVDDLCTLMIAISDNTATNLLADLAGMDQVNRVMRDLGMTNSAMNRRMLGRRVGTKAGENWVSAADLTTAVSAILDGSAASTDSCERMKTMLVRQDQNRRVTRYAPEASRWGSKPGTLEGAVNDAGFIETGRGTVVVSVCTDGFEHDYEAELAMAEIARGAMQTLGLIDA